MGRRKIESYYDEYSTRYEAERREGYYSIINELEFSRIEPAVAGRVALEIGCGTGLILERTAAVAKQAFGIDLSRGMAAFAHRRKGLATAQASATDLPFADATFDIVYSFKVLPHVPDIGKAVREAHRVLRPGGTAFLEFYPPYTLKWLANRLSSLRGDEVYIRYDSIERIRASVRGLFRVRSVRGVRIFAPSRHFYTLPVVGRLFRWLERRFCDAPWARWAGGYLVVKLERIDG